MAKTAVDATGNIGAYPSMTSRLLASATNSSDTATFTNAPTTVRLNLLSV